MVDTSIMLTPLIRHRFCSIVLHHFHILAVGHQSCDSVAPTIWKPSVVLRGHPWLITCWLACNLPGWQSIQHAISTVTYPAECYAPQKGRLRKMRRDILGIPTSSLLSWNDEIRLYRHCSPQRRSLRDW